MIVEKTFNESMGIQMVVKHFLCFAYSLSFKKKEKSERWDVDIEMRGNSSA